MRIWEQVSGFKLNGPWLGAEDGQKEARRMARHGLQSHMTPFFVALPRKSWALPYPTSYMFFRRDSAESSVIVLLVRVCLCVAILQL